MSGPRPGGFRRIHLVWMTRRKFAMGTTIKYSKKTAEKLSLIARAPAQRCTRATNARYEVARRALVGTAASKENMRPNRNAKCAKRKRTNVIGPLEGSRKRRKQQNEIANAVITIARIVPTGDTVLAKATWVDLAAVDKISSERAPTSFSPISACRDDRIRS
jgi:hypothetical protein